MTTSIIHLAVGLVLLVAVNIVLGSLNALFDGSSNKVKLRNGIIKGITPTIFGPYNTCTPEGVDECVSWGDYFYMEALTRLTKDWELYW